MHSDRDSGTGTKKKILDALRRSPGGVRELASIVGVSEQAVRVHVTGLERDGVIEAAGERRTGSAGKPVTLFRLTNAALWAQSRGYAPFLGALVQELASVFPDQLEVILRRAGRRVANRSPRASGALAERAVQAATVLRELGADTFVDRDEDGFLVSCSDCVLGQVVEVNASACSLLEQMFTDIVGADVREQCDRTVVPPRCRFAVRR